MNISGLCEKLRTWESIKTHTAVWVLVAMTFLCYLPTLLNGFCLDDWVILNGPYPKTLQEIPYLFVEPMAHNLTIVYRPLTFLTFTVDYIIWGFAPFGFHLTNILLASAVAVSLFFFLKRILPLPCAFLAASLFAVLPGHSEAIIGAYNRSQVISTLGIIIALSSFSRILNGDKKYWAAVSALAVLFGCFAKESALITPLLALLLAYQRPWKTKKAQWTTIALQGLACLCYLILRRKFVGSIGFANADSFVANTSLLTHYFNSCRVLSIYFRLAVFPHALSCDYPLQAISFHWSGLFYPLVVLTAVYWLCRGHDMQKLAGFCILWFVIALLPVLNILPLQISFAERLLYTASPAFAIAFACAVFRLQKGKIWPWALIACMIFLTMVRSMDWRDNSTLWHRALKTTPDSYRARIFIASEYAKKARDKMLRKNFSQAQALYRKSIAYYLDALNHNPNRTNRALVYYNLYAIWLDLQNEEKAAFYRDCLLKLNPRHPWLCESLGDRAFREKKWNEAISWYAKIPSPVNRWDEKRYRVKEKIRKCWQAIEQK